MLGNQTGFCFLVVLTKCSPYGGPWNIFRRPKNNAHLDSTVAFDSAYCVDFWRCLSMEDVKRNSLHLSNLCNPNAEAKFVLEMAFLPGALLEVVFLRVSLFFSFSFCDWGGCGGSPTPYENSEIHICLHKTVWSVVWGPRFAPGWRSRDGVQPADRVLAFWPKDHGLDSSNRWPTFSLDSHYWPQTATWIWCTPLIH